MNNSKVLTENEELLVASMELFETVGVGLVDTGRGYEIQRNDELDKFATDFDAIKFVIANKDSSNGIYGKMIAFIEEHGTLREKVNIVKFS